MPSDQTTRIPAVPIRTPMFEGGTIHALTRTWIIFFERLGRRGLFRDDYYIRFIDGANPLQVGSDLMYNHYQVPIKDNEQVALRHLMVKLKSATSTQSLIIDILLSTDNGDNWDSLFASGDANKIVVPAATKKLVWTPTWAITRLLRNEILRYDVIQADGSNAEVVIVGRLEPKREWV